MKNLKLLLIAAMILAIGSGIAGAAAIDIDEDFNDGVPFENLKRNYADTYIATSATIKGINVYDQGFVSAGPATATILAYNPSSANWAGSIKQLGTTSQGKAWKLNATQRLLWGKAGALSGTQESGDGPVGGYLTDGTTTTNMDSGAGNELQGVGTGIVVAQAAVAFDTTATLQAAGTSLGSLKLYFGNIATSVTHDASGKVTEDGIPATHTLVYNFLSNGAGVVQVKKVCDGASGSSTTIGTIAGDTWSMITTVIDGQPADTDAGQKWGTMPKLYYTGNNGSGSWKISGSADGRLYPNGKGWPTGTRLTSSTLGLAVYSFVNANPAGTTVTTAVVDSPWLPNGPKVDAGQGKVRTWKIEAGSGNAMYVDDIYLESDIRTGTMDSGLKQNADYRLHAFVSKATGLAGVPVELSVFTLR